MFGSRTRSELPTDSTALAGRDTPIGELAPHFVNGHPIASPFGAQLEIVHFGMGCFWGAERVFWQIPGVYTTAVGYGGGITPHPSYEEVCSGRTGHTELVLVAHDPSILSFEHLVKAFWEGHDPTQGMRQGNDRGTQYRSGLYYYDDAQKALAFQSAEAFQKKLEKAGYGAVTTEILAAPEYYFAEAEHQQYLAKNPQGYCGLGGTGIRCSG